MHVGGAENVLDASSAGFLYTISFLHAARLIFPLFQELE